MKLYQLDKDIKVFYVAADSFPIGVKEAHEKLHSLLPSAHDRNFFGISRPEGNGVIEYKAAVEETFPGEGEKYGCPTFVIPMGNYISQKLQDWEKDVTVIGRTFEKLLTHPDIDPDGFCLEMYLDKSEMICMVNLVK